MLGKAENTFVFSGKITKIIQSVVSVSEDIERAVC